MSPPCAGCKYLRRKCNQECVFAPHFPPEQPQRFANVHKVFGASNVAKLLNELNPTQREEAVNSLVFEAEANLRYPVYGCVGLISILQHRLRQVQADLINAKQELANYIGPSAMLPIFQNPGFVQQQQHPSNPAAAVMPYDMQPMLGQQMEIRDPQQQMLEAQQLAVVAAREQQQELMRTYDPQQQQPPELVRFNSGFETGGAQVTGSGFNNQMGGSGSDMSPTLGSYHENPYQIQQQPQDHQAQQLQVHPQLLLQQQQQELMRFNSGFETGEAQTTGSGFNNQIGGSGSDMSVTLGSYHENPYQIQQQPQDHQAQQLQVHPQLLLQQQQPELMRFNSGFETGEAQITGSGFNNQMGGSGSDMSPTLGSYQENPYQVQQQPQDHQAQQLQVHPELLLQQQQQQHPSNPAAAVMPYNMQPMLGQQMVIRDPQQQMLEAQQLAVVVAREQQELMRTYDPQQQQPELMRFKSGFETGGAQVTGSGFNNQMGGSGSDMPLTLESYQENPYQIQQQTQDNQAQQLQVHPQFLLQQQQQPQVTPQQCRAASEEGRSAGPSC